jgi:hypothetical protein
LKLQSADELQRGKRRVSPARRRRKIRGVYAPLEMALHQNDNRWEFIRVDSCDSAVKSLST